MCLILMTKHDSAGFDRSAPFGPSILVNNETKEN